MIGTPACVLLPISSEMSKPSNLLLCFFFPLAVLLCHCFQFLQWLYASYSPADVIKYNGKLITPASAVKRWFERYESNSKSALVELLMMLFEVMAVSYKVSKVLLCSL